MTRRVPRLFVWEARVDVTIADVRHIPERLAATGAANRWSDFNFNFNWFAFQGTDPPFFFSGTPREMIARPKVSHVEWNVAERGNGWTRTSHPCAAQAATGRTDLSEKQISKMIGKIFTESTQVNLHSEILDSARPPSFRPSLLRRRSRGSLS